MRTEALVNLAQQWRRDVLDMAYAAGSGHLGGSFSCAEIMAALYGRVLRIDPSVPDAPGRDRLILSKGHAAPMLYAAMCWKGFFGRELLNSLRMLDSPLQGHPCMFRLPGVDMSSGSLGLGLSVAVGMAVSLRRSARDARVYVLLGDGEMQEGQNWEAVMTMVSHRLDSITPIIDHNGVQLDGATEEIHPGQPSLAEKLAGFGLAVRAFDGHNMDAILDALDWAHTCKKPHILLAHTVKGRGVPFMEHQAAWHGRSLTEAEYNAALRAVAP